MISQNYVVNLVPNSKNVEIHMSQYDVEGRMLRFRFMNGTRPFKFPEESFCVIRGRKPDGKVFEYPAEHDNFYAMVAVEDQMTVVPGTVSCEIVIMKEGEVLGSANFKLSVETSPIQGDEESITHIPAVTKLINGGEIGEVMTWTGHGADWTTTGRGDMKKEVYDPDEDGKVVSAENADTVNDHTVERDVLSDEYTNEDIDDVLEDKVDKVAGKQLSTEDFTSDLKSKLSALPTATDLSTALNSKVDKEEGKGLSTEDYTSEEKEKLSGISAGAQVNVLEGVKVNGTALPISEKAVNIMVDATPTANSTNPVQSGGVKTALDGKVDTSELTGVAQDSTGLDIEQELIKDGALTAELFLTVFNSIPSDESVMEIYDELVIGNSYLDLLVAELQKGVNV